MGARGVQTNPSNYMKVSMMLLKFSGPSQESTEGLITMKGSQENIQLPSICFNEIHFHGKNFDSERHDTGINVLLFGGQKLWLAPQHSPILVTETIFYPENGLKT